MGIGKEVYRLYQLRIKRRGQTKKNLVAETLYKSMEIEKWGSGLKRIYEQCMEQGVKVEFKVLKSGFMTVFSRVTILTV